jgi:hypothetical protein
MLLITLLLLVGVVLALLVRVAVVQAVFLLFLD